ncbi:cytochrome P450 [Clohesyomyces aquaticus]|uniref:Cytochrome P450 n=1 Tax=Clohesyomyces aquaticus TaxID=1231657 RepID=A0A1Y1Z4N6_9PLEO|nr:cytochrome P450 [Clohesyomyces aquaticus]
MAFSNAVALFGAAIGFVVYRFIIFPLFVSPLRHIPTAHPTARLSSLWLLYLRRGDRQALSLISSAHRKSGDVVLLAPNEVSVASLEGVKKVYIEKGGFAKTKWFADLFITFGGGEARNMVSMIGGMSDRLHRARKADVGNVYSKTQMLASEQMVVNADRIIRGKMLSAIGDAVRDKNGVLEVYGFNGAVSADIASGFMWGEEGSTNFIQDLSSGADYFRNHTTWLKFKPGAREAQTWLESFGLKRCAAAEEQVQRDEEMGNSGQKAYPVVYGQLRKRGLRGNTLAAETFDHYLAGAEGPRTNLTYAQWELSRHSEMQARLRGELSALSFQDGLPELKVLDALPLLEAIVTETLRVYTPTPGPMFRLTPPEGTTIDGKFIPGNIQISASPAILHHNPAVFPDSEKWDPDRWVIKSEKDQTKVDEMRRWFFAFSGGSRTCIGKEFALLAMKLTLAAIYTQYTTSIVDDEGIEQDDKFLAGPKGEKLVLKFNRLA